MTEERREEGRAAPRRRWPGWRPAALVASAVLASGLAIVALRPPAGDGAHYAGIEASVTDPAATRDPLMAELVRCRDLPADRNDPACVAAWAENRRHFFGTTRAMRVPGDPMPAYAPIPAATANQTPPASPAPVETEGER